MICSNALTSPNDSLLQATSRRLEYLGLHTLRATSTGDTEAVSALFAQFINCTYRSYALEERWLSEEFGAAYVADRRRTRALVPGVI